MKRDKSYIEDFLSDKKLGVGDSTTVTQRGLAEVARCCDPFLREPSVAQVESVMMTIVADGRYTLRDKEIPGFYTLSRARLKAKEAG